MEGHRIAPTTEVRLLIAIPCLNEATTIAQVIAAVPAEIQGIDNISILVVNDGSRDQTAEVARLAGATVISHSVNRGVGAAFQTAVNYAVSEKFDLMVNIDGDGQFNPADITFLVAPVISGTAEMVTASRFIDAALTPEMPLIKRYGNHMMSFLISKLVRKKFHDVSCGFRCYSREALLNLNLHGAFTYTQESFLDFASKSISISEVPIKVQYFDGRQSRVANSIRRYAINTALIIFRGYRDIYPLRFFWTISALFSLPAFIFAVLLFVHYLRTGMFSGYLFAGFLSGFFAILSIGFFILGIVTDMLDRIRRNQERILYLHKKFD
jgi:glycosyltransferase involved in cell wall biosynthesis